MNKHIILFGAGKSSTFLIRYLVKECAANNWHLTVADSNLPLAQSKTGVSEYASAAGISVEDNEQRSRLIREGDLIISLLPPVLHFLVAGDCLLFGKNLLTASYLDEKIIALAPAIKNKGLLFLCEMGLDPGIDHMSAVQLIQRIKSQGGEIVSFKSHCGGLLAPESDNNPWHYKISWNPRNVARAGASGAVFKDNNTVKHINYEQLFSNCDEVDINGLGRLAYYPNRDSLAYMKLYDVETAATFIRTTLRYPAFCRGWNYIVNAGLTNDKDIVDTRGLSFKNYTEKKIALNDNDISRQLEYLGLFEEKLIPVDLRTPADILQYLLEKNLMMQPSDKDMIVMLHEIEFKMNNTFYKTDSLLLVTGEDHVDTAMAKTVGLPLGLAASLILQDTIQLTGLHIPVIPEIYDPVLKQMEQYGIVFTENNSTPEFKF